MMLRFAVACRSGAVQAWQQRCIDRLFACASATWIALIETSEASALAPPAPPMFDVPAQRVAAVDFGDRDIKRLRADDSGGVSALGVDVVLSFDESTPPALASAARLGAWEFAFGSGDSAGAPTCFWECYRGEPVAHVALLARSGDGRASVLRRGAVAVDGTSLRASIDRALDAAATWPEIAARAIASGVALGDADATSSSSGPARPASASSAAVLSVKIVGRHFARAFDMMFADKWNVGIAHCSIDSFLQNTAWPRVDWLREPDDLDYRADPFGAAVDGRSWALVERYDARAARGRIEAIEIESSAWKNGCREAMTAPAHMSYPFLLTHAGQLYCVPETLGQGAVSLYRAVELPGRWEKVATLLDGFEAVDATIVRHEDRWWLFCTDFGEPRHHRLHAYYADELTGPYAPHELNPVKVDPRSAGCAGTPFYAGGSLYRPAQDWSQSYGGSVVLKRVIELTPQAFREEIAAVVSPNANYPAGVHTLSSLGSITLVDGKRRVFTLRRVAWRLAWPLRLLRGREG